MMKNNGNGQGTLFVISGPSGVGKGTLREHAVAGMDKIGYSISCTTRAPRPDERDGVDYRFISHDEFQNRVQHGFFLEYADVHGEYYGTLREDVLRVINSGYDIILEIDVQGALQVRKVIPQSVLIFIAPPSIDVLEERLHFRGTESEEKIKLRLHNAEKELSYAKQYDHVIVNDDLQQASNELAALIRDYRDKSRRD